MNVYVYQSNDGGQIKLYKRLTDAVNKSFPADTAVENVVDAMQDLDRIGSVNVWNSNDNIVGTIQLTEVIS